MTVKKTNDVCLTFDEILAAEDISEESLDIPAWKGKVKIRSITKRQMRDIKKAARTDDGEVDNDQMEKAIFIAGFSDATTTTSSSA